MPRSILLWGASGHALVVADAIRRSGTHALVGFLDDVNPERHGQAFGGATILGGRELLHRSGLPDQVEMLITIGDCAARMKLAAEAQRLGFHFATVIHPSAIIAADVLIGAGTFIAAGAVVNAGSTVGAHAIINTSASVDHECILAEGVHLGPGARLGGRVRVERGAWIGIGAAVRDRVTIGAAAMVGMGAVVVEDVPPATTVIGVPAKPMRKAPLV